MGTIRTMEQERARAAWRHIDQDARGKEWAKEYGQLARSAAADIQANGLGQTLAFWRAKGFEQGEPKKNGENAHAQIFKHVSAWVKLQLGYREDKNLLRWVMEDAGTDGYRRATAEAIAFLSWLKRFAEAELIKD